MARTPTYICMVGNVPHPEVANATLCTDMGGRWEEVKPRYKAQFCLINGVYHPELDHKKSCEDAGGDWYDLSSTPARRVMPRGTVRRPRMKGRVATKTKARAKAKASAKARRPAKRKKSNRTKRVVVTLSAAKRSAAKRGATKQRGTK